jgi:hypothetical protein
VQPLASDEQVNDRDAVVTRYRIHTGPTADIKATDRIAWRGVVYEVRGDVEQHSRKGSPHHLELVVQRMEG